MPINSIWAATWTKRSVPHRTKGHNRQNANWMQHSGYAFHSPEQSYYSPRNSRRATHDSCCGYVMTLVDDIAISLTLYNRNTKAAETTRLLLWPEMQESHRTWQWDVPSIVGKSCWLIDSAMVPWILLLSARHSEDRMGTATIPGFSRCTNFGRCKNDRKERSAIPMCEVNLCHSVVWILRFSSKIFVSAYCCHYCTDDNDVIMSRIPMEIPARFSCPFIQQWTFKSLTYIQLGVHLWSWLLGRKRWGILCLYTTLWNVSVLKATIKNKTTSVTTHFK